MLHKLSHGCSVSITLFLNIDPALLLVPKWIVLFNDVFNFLLMFSDFASYNLYLDGCDDIFNVLFLTSGNLTSSLAT